MFKEFKEFAMKGNVLDMAVGVIIGAAFTKIVTSLVNDMVMPVVGLLVGKVDFKNLAIVLKDATETAPAVKVGYGIFINNILDFTIVAFSIFMAVKMLNKVSKKPAASPAPAK